MRRSLWPRPALAIALIIATLVYAEESAPLRATSAPTPEKTTPEQAATPEAAVPPEAAKSAIPSREEVLATASERKQVMMKAAADKRAAMEAASGASGSATGASGSATGAPGSAEGDSGSETGKLAASAQAAMDEQENEDDNEEDDVEDVAALCHPWAASGECIRNPQYMYHACEHACDAQNYVDTDQDCGGWAEVGECEKNAEFMLHNCNHSCITKAKLSLRQPSNTVRKNPHLLGNEDDDDDDDEEEHRLQTFLPIFFFVLLLLIGFVVVRVVFSSALAAKQESFDDALARARVRFQRNYPKLSPWVLNITVSNVGTFMICIYYINEGFTVVQTSPTFASLLSYIMNTEGVWSQHTQWLDLTNLAGAVAAVLCILKVKPLWMSVIMMGDTLADSYLLLSRIVYGWLYGNGLYINELMAKKFSLLGCVAMMIVVSLESSKRQTSFSGLLLEANTLSTKASISMLIARLLIAFLFLYVGLSELHRLFFQPYTLYMPGDGHDVVWPKCIELLLCLPFILGFQTNTVSRLLALSLVLEALYAWSWWSIPGDRYSYSHHRRAIHYREHFVTNVATAGGLILLQKIGGGKYTVDELLKKKD